MRPGWGLSLTSLWLLASVGCGESQRQERPHLVHFGPPGDAGTVARSTPGHDFRDAGAAIGSATDAGAGSTLPLSLCPRPGTSAAPTNTALRLDLDAGPPHWERSRPIAVLVDGVSVGIQLRVDGNSLIAVPEQPFPSGARVDVELGPLEDGQSQQVALDGGWSFVVGSGPAEGPGFTFGEPWVPLGGDSAASRALVMDGETSILAWATPYTLWVHRIQDGGTVRAQWLHSQLFTDQISLAATPERLYASWTYFGSSGDPLVALDRTDRLLQSTPSDPLGLLAAAPRSVVRAGPADQVVVAFDVDLDTWGSIGARVTTSLDHGEHWTGTVEIGPDAYCPDLLYFGQRLLAVWIPDGLGGPIRILTSYSDNDGASFSPPQTIVTAPGTTFCPKLVDAHDGTAFLTWDPLGSDRRSPWGMRIDADGGVVDDARPLLPPDATHACTTLAMNERGQLLLVRSRGHVFAEDWVSEAFRSADGGLEFGEPGRVPVIGPADGCPLVGFHPSGMVDLAWVRGQDLHLFVSTGGPNRPCEP